MRSFVHSVIALFALGISVAVVSGCAGSGRGSDPVVDSSSTSKGLQNLQRPAERVTVGIYEFRSTVSQVSSTAASDMFVTALVRSGQFAVVERSRLNANVMREKQMNAAGQTTGNTAQQQLLEARYLFEGTVSEDNRDASTSKNSVSIGGANIGGGSRKDTIAVDVRIIDANNGAILDSVAVRKDVAGSSVNVSGVHDLAVNLLERRGRSGSTFTPDAAHESSRKESVDAALRSCIELAVLEISKRLQRPQ